MYNHDEYLEFIQNLPKEQLDEKLEFDFEINEQETSNNREEVKLEFVKYDFFQIYTLSRQFVENIFQFPDYEEKNNFSYMRLIDIIKCFLRESETEEACEKIIKFQKAWGSDSVLDNLFIYICEINPNSIEIVSGCCSLQILETIIDEYEDVYLSIIELRSDPFTTAIKMDKYENAKRLVVYMDRVSKYSAFSSAISSNKPEYIDMIYQNFWSKIVPDDLLNVAIQSDTLNSFTKLIEVLKDYIKRTDSYYMRNMPEQQKDLMVTERINDTLVVILTNLEHKYFNIKNDVFKYIITNFTFDNDYLIEIIAGNSDLSTFKYLLEDLHIVPNLDFVFEYAVNNIDSWQNIIEYLINDHDYDPTAEQLFDIEENLPCFEYLVNLVNISPEDSIEILHRARRIITKYANSKKIKNQKEFVTNKMKEITKIINS